MDAIRLEELVPVENRTKHQTGDVLWGVVGLLRSILELREDCEVEIIDVATSRADCRKGSMQFNVPSRPAFLQKFDCIKKCLEMRGYIHGFGGG